VNDRSSTDPVTKSCRWAAEAAGSGRRTRHPGSIQTSAQRYTAVANTARRRRPHRRAKSVEEGPNLMRYDEHADPAIPPEVVVISCSVTARRTTSDGPEVRTAAPTFKAFKRSGTHATDRTAGLRRHPLGITHARRPRPREGGRRRTMPNTPLAFSAEFQRTKSASGR
jgi:hypothetical protein